MSRTQSQTGNKNMKPGGDPGDLFDDAADLVAGK